MDYQPKNITLRMKRPWEMIAGGRSAAVFQAVFEIIPPREPKKKVSSSLLQQRSTASASGKTTPGRNGTSYISTHEAEEEYGIGVRQLQKLCRNSDVRAKKIKGRWRIDRRSLESWLKRQDE